MRYYIPLMILIATIDLIATYFSWYWKVSGIYHQDELWKSTVGLIFFPTEFGIICLLIIRRIRK